ncbi:MAG: PAS domain S-box protein [Anaerolineae bacterium]|nr:PAS domain S-box protein [Anaerolineae bacterium]
MTTSCDRVDERILILAPTGRDGPLATTVLTQTGLSCIICNDLADLLNKLAEGAGALLITEEALQATSAEALIQTLQNQPTWSELPFILLTSQRHEQQPKNLESFYQWAIDVHVTLLKQPVSTAALVTIVQTALRARRRQYQVRDLMTQLQTQNRQLEQEIDERKQAEIRLQALNETLEQRVSERTVALETINHRLNDKVARLKKAEQVLAEERHLLRTLIDNIPDHIYVKDDQSRFVIGNSYVVQVMGANTEAEILHKTDFDFYPASLANRYHTDDMLVLHSGRPLVEREEPLIDPTGKQRWLLTTKVPLYDKNGTTTGLVGISRDITHRKQTQQALRDSEERFRKIFEDGPLGMAVLDCTSRYITVNTKLGEMLGYTESQLADQTPFRFIHWEDVENYRRLADQFLQGKITDYHIEQRYVTQSGNLVWVSLTAALLTTGEKNTPYRLEMIQNITERKKIEQERLTLLVTVSRQHQQLRVLSARLAEVQETERQHLARELHDKVGQALTALNFNLGYIHTQISRGSGALAQDRLNQAVELVETAMDHIRNVMADLNPPLLDEAGLIEALSCFAERFTGWSGVPVTIENITPESRPTASMERTLFRIAQEALTNVAKHAEATEATIRFESNDGELRLIIADNGKGFSTAVARNHKNPDHWGLLAMAERAEMVNGHCRIESQPGKGTRVIVNVPSLARVVSN